MGDPAYRGLSKMEADPLIPQRMRDIARTQLCTEYVREFEKCSKDTVCAFNSVNYHKCTMSIHVILLQGLRMWYSCRGEKEKMVDCLKVWFYDDEFKEAVIEEYLNERSHYRQTGKKHSS